MSAKDIFEKLGYKLVNTYDENYIEYRTPENINPCMRFNKEDKTFYKYWWYLTCEEAVEITLEELQAINQQVKELGWLDE